MTVKDACESFSGYKEICLTVGDMNYSMAVKEGRSLDPCMIDVFGNCVVDYILSSGEGAFLINAKIQPVRA